VIRNSTAVLPVSWQAPVLRIFCGIDGVPARAGPTAFHVNVAAFHVKRPRRVYSPVVRFVHAMEGAIP